MDTKNENKKFRNTPEWAEYQRQNFWKANEGEVPPFNTGMLARSWQTIEDTESLTRPHQSRAS